MASSREDCLYECISKHYGTLKEEDIDEIFNKYDKDGNGYIDAKELEDFLKEICHKELSDVEFSAFKSKVLDMLDKNDDGKIDKEELTGILPTKKNFLLQFSKKGRKICVVDFNKIWNHYDADQSGSLEGSELEAFLRDLISKCCCSGQVVVECELPYIHKLKACLLNKYDKEKSGKLSRNDLVDILQVDVTCEVFFKGKGWTSGKFDENFAKYDKDGSGSIDECELATLFKDMLSLDGNDMSSGDIDAYVQIVKAKLDKDSDGKIQKEELKSFLDNQ